MQADDRMQLLRIAAKLDQLAATVANIASTRDQLNAATQIAEIQKSLLRIQYELSTKKGE